MKRITIDRKNQNSNKTGEKMQEELHNKLADLKEYIKELDSVAIAFSSGVDSTFLLKVAHEILGDNVMAITVQSLSLIHI